MSIEAQAAAPRPIARALRTVAAAWIVYGVVELGLDLWRRSLFEQVRAGTEYAVVSERLAALGWAGAAAFVIVGVVIVIGASTWARASGRTAWVVRLGQVTLAIALLGRVGLLLAQQGNRDFSDYERLASFGIGAAIAWNSALAAIVVGTRGSTSLRVVYTIAAAVWIGLLVGVRTEIDPMWSEVLRFTPLAMSAVWSASLWFGASAYADVEPTPDTDRVPIDDPTRLRASAGLTTLRAGLIVRIVVSVIVVAGLVWLRREPGSASALVWISALVQCGIAVVLGSALTQYSSLPDAAIERGHINVALACLAIGALLELAGANLTSELLGYAGRARAGRLYDMPGLDELEALQTKATWLGRGGSITGIVGAVSLSLSLRKTALWVDDAASVGRASTLAVVTILGGGVAVVLVGLAQSGAIRDLPTLAVLALVSLGLSITVLTLWLRLVGALAVALRGDAVELSAR